MCLCPWCLDHEGGEGLTGERLDWSRASEDHFLSG